MCARLMQVNREGHGDPCCSQPGSVCRGKVDGLREKADLGVTSMMHLLPTGHTLYQNGSPCNTVWILGCTLLIFLYGELFKT